MQKGLCIAALAISIIVFLLFAADLAFGLAGQQSLAPFRFQNQLIDIVFVVCSLIVGVLSWFTFKEQV